MCIDMYWDYCRVEATTTKTFIISLSKQHIRNCINEDEHISSRMCKLMCVCSFCAGVGPMILCMPQFIVYRSRQQRNEKKRKKEIVAFSTANRLPYFPPSFAYMCVVRAFFNGVCSMCGS